MITYRIDKQAGIVFAMVEGRITLEEMVQTISRVANDPDFHTGFGVLSDHRTIEIPATTQQVSGFIQHAKRLSSTLGGTRWAIVVSSDGSFGMMRMLSAFAESVPLHVEVFRDYEKALGWLQKE